MKKITSVCVLVILMTFELLAQNSGKGFNFQAVARNSDGSVKATQAIELKITIYPAAAKSAALYIESSTTNTDKFGVFSLIIGKGTYIGGSKTSFGEINFADVSAYLNVMLKDGGSDIEIVHAPLLSVPYAETSTEADNGLPIGSIIPYAGEVPDNTDDITVFGCKGTWKLCNGQTYDETEFQMLDQVLNGAWGDNLLPDLRGVFLRGTNYTANDDFRDPESDNRGARNDGNTGNKVGSYQWDEVGPHQHDFKDSYRPNNQDVDGDGGIPADENVADDARTELSKTTDPNGGLETRPKNANVNFIIRVK